MDTPHWKLQQGGTTTIRVMRPCARNPPTLFCKNRRSNWQSVPQVYNASKQNQRVIPLTPLQDSWTRNRIGRKTLINHKVQQQKTKCYGHPPVLLMLTSIAHLTPSGRQIDCHNEPITFISSARPCYFPLELQPEFLPQTNEDVVSRNLK